MFNNFLFFLMKATTEDYRAMKRSPEQQAKDKQIDAIMDEKKKNMDFIRTQLLKISERNFITKSDGTDPINLIHKHLENVRKLCVSAEAIRTN